MNVTDELKAATAARDEILAKSAALADRASKLSAAKSARDDAKAAVAEIDQRETEALNAWATAGAQGAPPVGDSKAREQALRKLAAAHESAKAIDHALVQLERQNAELAQELAVVQARVRTATAKHLAEMHRVNVAEQRDLEDQLEVKRTLGAGFFQQMAQRDSRVADDALKSREIERTAWIQTRGDVNQAAIDAQWHKTISVLPAA